MSADVGFNDWFGVPGGDDFVEVTDLFLAGSRDFESGEVLLMDGFTLMDAMSAFEIGEPRLDSGMILEEQRRPQFDPLAPLLPEEVCWLLDRSFACEMEWHAGKTLSQSVFTILYVHHLPDINPDYLHPQEFQDLLRPQWLITVVLRAGMLGLLKCCDLAWRELSKNRLHEVEDWQAEKCDVSLLEVVDIGLVIHMLNAACNLLQQSDLAEDHITALCDRLILRRTLLQMFTLNLLHEAQEMVHNVAHARGLLHRVRTTHQEELPSESPARLAMDPHIARRLPNFMPIRVTDLPPPEHTWDALDSLFDCWSEFSNLVDSPSIFKWEAAGSLGYALKKKLPVAFQRSLVQTLFYDKELVLGSRRPTWLVEQFYYETIGLPYTTILQCIHRGPYPGQHFIEQDIVERRIMKLIVPHLRSNWYNPPRRRRQLMKEVLQWHMLYDLMLKDVGKCNSPDPDTAAVLAAIPQAAQHWRLAASRNIILTGFQQELYAPEEIPIAYWCLSRVLDAHLACIENLLPVVPPATSAYLELKFQADHLSALQLISTTLVALTSGHITSPWSRLSVNFRRRYKWAFNPEFDKLVPLEPRLDLEDLPPVLEEMHQQELYSPSASFRLAQDILQRLGESSYDWVGHWSDDRKEYLHRLADVCDRLEHATPSSMIELSNFDTGTLKWIPDVHPWFPTVVSDSYS